MKRKNEENKQNPKHGPRRRLLTVLLLIAAVLLAAAAVLTAIAFSKVRQVVTIELGEDSPEVSAFLHDRNDAVRYDTAPEPLYKAAGDYPLRVRVWFYSIPVVLRVRDTVPPDAEGIITTISTKQAPTPDKLIKNLKDKSVVKITFETAPDYGTVGDYEAVILIEDASGNQTRVHSMVHIRAAIDGITVEAGDPAPQAEDFLIDRYEHVEMQPITEEMLHEPGEYTIRITADGAETETKLIVRDTVPPTGRGVTRIAGPDEPILAENFVAGVRDETAVTATFAVPPDPMCREPQTLEIVLTDRGGNQTRVTAKLLITGVTPIAIEAHSDPLTISELHLEGTYQTAEIAEPFVPDEPGAHVIPVLIDGKENLALIEVRDTTPPTIRVLKTDGYTHHPMPVEELAAAEDATGVEFAYLNEPDWTKETQDVTVYAVDSVGNRSETTFTLELAVDAEPPVLYGVIDRIAYVGEPIIYLGEVYAEDDIDGRVKVTVESEVQPDRAGRYRVVYTAEDVSGNRVSEECVFRLVDSTVSEEEVRELARGVLESIVTDDMVTAEKLKAVFDYVRKNVHYVGNSDKSDWRKEAARGFRTGRGDCFTFYSVTRALLDELGVEYMSLTRLGGSTRHYWVIVNIGTGWYHFDPTLAPRHKHVCFMWTNEQCKVKPYFWRYDHTPYPDIATERFDYDEVVRMEKEGLLP